MGCCLHAVGLFLVACLAHDGDRQCVLAFLGMARRQIVLLLAGFIKFGPKYYRAHCVAVLVGWAVAYMLLVCFWLLA